MACNWKTKNTLKSTDVIRALPWDEALLKQISEEAPLDTVRKAAAATLRVLPLREEYYSSHEAQRCKKCSTPLTPAEFVTAKETRVVTGKKTVYEGGRSKTITSYRSTYSELKQHTGCYCANCLNRRQALLGLIGAVFLLLGILAILSPILYAMIADKGDLNMLPIILGAIAAFAGYQTLTTHGGLPICFPDMRTLPATPRERLLHDREAAELRSSTFVTNARKSVVAKNGFNEPIPSDRAILSLGFVRQHQAEIQ